MSEDQVRQMAVDLDGWPDSARPGVPLNPERDGRHRVRTSLHNELTMIRRAGEAGGSWAMPDYESGRVPGRGVGRH